MICPRCGSHHDSGFSIYPRKEEWCVACHREFTEGRVHARRDSCEEVLGCLGIGDGLMLSHLDDAADFEAATAGLIMTAVRGGKIL